MKNHQNKNNFDGKEELLCGAGDDYFERNYVDCFNINDKLLAEGNLPEISKGCQFLNDFLTLNNNLFDNSNKIKVLELGACWGFNLINLNSKRNFTCKGIEPSKKAIDCGNELAGKHGLDVTLVQGTTDDLPYDDEYFDIILVGFCLYWVDRKYYLRTISEIDRVLKTGGIIVIEDFDTIIPYVKDNKHTNTNTYKRDNSIIFTSSLHYSLIEKRIYSHDKCGIFEPNMQERCSCSILYKEPLKNTYVLSD